MSKRGKRADRIVYRPERWPERDRLAWAVATRAGDPFEDAGPAALWRPKTRDRLIQAYGRWIGFLDGRGHLDPAAAPTARVTADRVSRYVALLRSQCLDTTVIMYMDGLARALGILAPEGDWAWLQGVARRCRAEARTRKPKAARIRASRELLELGVQLMDDAGVASPLAWKQAVRFRDGLMIAVLAARPLRLTNFAGLQIDRHLVRIGDDFWLMLSPEETKTHVHIELPIPKALQPYLEHYLEEHRRTLSIGRTSPFLWLTHDGRPLRPHAVYQAIVKRTRKAFGLSVNPHLFRDCAATSLAIEDPEHVRAASALLGHASLASTTKYYNQATTLSASRQHTRAMMALRRGKGRRRSAEWRPL